ncbi:MAG: hypothetical protein RMI94_09330 [Bryobacterales bacterium]|nr:hypothetical protein [Bryobacteraceae bacterium]MDW8130735.1 hypothetical protein [Bryobacterales bacterium]
MLPAFLIPESILREDGSGPAVPLGPAQGKLLLLTLGITRVIEQESLEVSIWGSADGGDWRAKPLLVLPQKFYCGVYRFLLDLTGQSEIGFLQARWKVHRWGRGDPKPLFGVWMAAEQIEAQALRAGSG